MGVGWGVARRRRVFSVVARSHAGLDRLARYGRCELVWWRGLRGALLDTTPVAGEWWGGVEVGGGRLKHHINLIISPEFTNSLPCGSRG